MIADGFKTAEMDTTELGANALLLLEHYCDRVYREADAIADAVNSDSTIPREEAKERRRRYDGLYLAHDHLLALHERLATIIKQVG
jgi:hypothetical protein